MRAYREIGLEPEGRRPRLGGPGLVNRRDVGHGRDGRQVEVTRRMGHMLGDKAREFRMAYQEPRDCCCFEQPARGVPHGPQAGYFPFWGGGGPSLRLSLCSSSSWISRAFISSA